MTVEMSRPFYGHEVQMCSDPKGWEVRIVFVREDGRQVLAKNVFSTWFEADEWGEREAARYRVMSSA